MNYYNEWDSYAAQWIRNLIDAGLIPPGHVDTRSITDVQPSDLAGYRQCHFFCGIAGWSLAARLAGWPDDRELWTGSAPCQPFSVAGKGKAQDDDRHLWPHFLRLIRARRPAVVMGEQVAAAVGKNWLDGVSADLEGIDYACRAAVVPACAVDAPHQRDRLWFVAHHDLERSGQERQQRGRQQRGASGHPENHARPMVDVTRLGWGEGWTQPELRGRRLSASVASVSGRQFIECADGKWRRLPPPRVRWLGTRIPARVGRLRAYGNAIVPALAAEVIGAYMDCYPDPDEQLRAALATN
ncbi:DNA cytosine methyltransferase [Stenotrophomonas maltophilia]